MANSHYQFLNTRFFCLSPMLSHTQSVMSSVSLWTLFWELVHLKNRPYEKFVWLVVTFKPCYTSSGNWLHGHIPGWSWFWKVSEHLMILTATIQPWSRRSIMEGLGFQRIANGSLTVGNYEGTKIVLEKRNRCWNWDWNFIWSWWVVIHILMVEQ